MRLIGIDYNGLYRLEAQLPHATSVTSARTCELYR